MSKNREKKSPKKKNQKSHIELAAVKATAEAFSYTERYVNQCLAGDRKGIMADCVVNDYKTRLENLTQAIEK